MSTNSNPIELSIVIPAFNEEKNLGPLTEKIKSKLDPHGLSYEVIYVDDGSSDQTFKVIEELHQADERFRGVRLKRNFGKSEAYMVGFEMASGELVATMDGDLQDDPEDLLKLKAEVEAGTDMVIGWKSSGKSSPSTFIFSKLFNGLIRSFTGSKVHDLNCPIRVMRKEVAEDIEIHAALHRYIPILAAKKGYSVKEVKVSNLERLHGTSNYSYWKYIESFFDLLTVLFVTNYKNRPLQFLGPIGFASMTIGFFIDLYFLILEILEKESLRHNIPSLLLGLFLFMMGLQIVLTGLIGEMMSSELNSGRKRYKKSAKTLIGLRKPDLR